MLIIRHFDETGLLSAAIPGNSSGKAQTRRAIPWVICAVRQIFHKF
ncbi:hypothetical protein [Stappia indica]|nr:hypothetical protein [Stappia indica]